MERNRSTCTLRLRLEGMPPASLPLQSLAKSVSPHFAQENSEHRPYEPFLALTPCLSSHVLYSIRPMCFEMGLARNWLHSDTANARSGRVPCIA